MFPANKKGETMQKFKIHVHEISLIQHCLLVSAEFIGEQSDNETIVSLSKILHQESFINSKGYKTIAIDSNCLDLLIDYLLIAILAINNSKRYCKTLINEIIYLLQYLKD